MRQINNRKINIYLNDAHGTVLNFTESKKNNYQYDAYGKLIKNNKYNTNINLNSSELNLFFYNSQRYNDHTNLQYLRSRFYCPHLKRFITQDSIALINRFNYAATNPILNSDQNGHMPSCCDTFSLISKFLKDNFFNPLKNICCGAATYEDVINIAATLITPETVCPELTTFAEKILLEEQTKPIIKLAIFDLDQTLWRALTDADGELIDIEIKKEAHEALQTIFKNKNAHVIFNTFGDWEEETLEKYLPEITGKNYALLNAELHNPLKTKSCLILEYIQKNHPEIITDKNQIAQFIFFDDGIENLLDVRQCFAKYPNIAKTLVHVNLWNDTFPKDILYEWVNEPQLYFSHCLKQDPETS